jgi:FKBP-type peptidyl-prolyl cis-trans isomerase
MSRVIGQRLNHVKSKKRKSLLPRAHAVLLQYDFDFLSFGLRVSLKESVTGEERKEKEREERREMRRKKEEKEEKDKEKEEKEKEEKEKKKVKEKKLKEKKEKEKEKEKKEKETEEKKTNLNPKLRILTPAMKFKNASGISFRPHIRYRNPGGHGEGLQGEGEATVGLEHEGPAEAGGESARDDDVAAPGQFHAEGN